MSKHSVWNEHSSSLQKIELNRLYRVKKDRNSLLVYVNGDIVVSYTEQSFTQLIC